MSFWKNLRTELLEKSTPSDATTAVYKKIATSGTNMLGIILPSFYIGQLSSLSYDYMCYVEKFLAAEERDWGEYLKFMLYIREMSKRILSNIQYLQEPLGDLIRSLEEIYEGEAANPEDEYEDEPEPENLEEPENIDSILSGEVMDEDREEEKDESSDYRDEISTSGISREDLAEDYEIVKHELLEKLYQADIPDRRVTEELSRELADAYLECVQLAKEIVRLRRMPDGDLATLMSILVDIQYGMCHEMKRHLMEDVLVEDRFSFNPGVLTWTAHFLSHFSEKFNEG